MYYIIQQQKPTTMKIESTHLVTLSQFVTNIKEEGSSLSSRDAQEIVLYNDFLKQPLTIEMFDIGEERLFKGFNFENFSTQRWYCIHKNCKVPSIIFLDNEVIDGPRTLADLAEATKENPLRFKKQPYFDNEEIH